jgi:hypothetical protein
MADVFVSYSHSNLDRIGPLTGAISASGYSLWWDEQLLPSDAFALVIEREIHDARCVVVAWSATARDSLWVRAEANEALDAGKLVQLTLDGAKLPLPFTALHFLDFTRWGGDRGGTPWPDLDGRIGATLRGEASGAEIGAREPRLQGLGPVAMLGGAAIMLALLVALAAGAAATGALPAAQFAAISLFGAAAAAILLALVAWRTARILQASRR